jgi:tetratricopeptide (TPR) repeat protein
VITTALGDAFAETMSQEMARQLAAFPGLRVVGPIPSDAPNAAATGLGVRFVLHVATTHDATAAELYVLDTTSDATVWTAREKLPVQDPAGFDVGQWAHSIAGQIGDYTGVILKRLAESQRPGESEWQAMQAYYAAYTSGDRQAVIPAADRLAQVVASGRRSPTIVAALAHSLSLRAAYEFTDDVAADLAEATSLAREALAVEPGSATAHLALATVALVSGQAEGAQEHAFTAADLAPYHPSLLQTAGTLIALAGDWDKGIAVIRQAMDLNPNLPGYMRQLLVMDHLFAGDDALALAEASRIETPTEVWGPYFRALSLMGLGYRERAQAEMQAARAIDPTVLDDSYDLVQEWVQLTPEQSQVLTGRLRMFQPHE